MKDNIELINFIDMNEEESLLVLSWRNSESIRKWMYDSEIIPKQNHFKFIDSLRSSSSKQYFLVKLKDKYIGVIDFVNIKQNSAHMGIYSSPHLKGYGEVLLDCIIDYAFNSLKLKKIIAEVYVINERAVSLYKSKGFIIIDEKVFNDKNLHCMELKNVPK